MASKKKPTPITQHKGPVLKPVRKLRHWKQQYDKTAQFLWRKNVTYGTTQFLAGQAVPEGLLPPVKLRRFWESRLIELADFSEPDVQTGKKAQEENKEVASPKKVKPKKKEQPKKKKATSPKKIRRGKWEAGGKMFKSKTAAQAFLDNGGEDE